MVLSLLRTCPGLHPLWHILCLYMCVFGVFPCVPVHPCIGHPCCHATPLLFLSGGQEGSTSITKEASRWRDGQPACRQHDWGRRYASGLARYVAFPNGRNRWMWVTGKSWRHGTGCSRPNAQPLSVRILPRRALTVSRSTSQRLRRDSESLGPLRTPLNNHYGSSLALCTESKLQSSQRASAITHFSVMENLRWLTSMLLVFGCELTHFIFIFLLSKCYYSQKKGLNQHNQVFQDWDFCKSIKSIKMLGLF